MLNTVEASPAAVPDDAPIARRPMWKIWLSSLALLIVLAFIAYHLANISSFDYAAVRRYQFSDLMMRGLFTTIELALLSFVAAMVVSVGVAGMRLSTNPVARCVAWLFVWFFRGTPMIIQLIFWYNLALIVPRISIGIPGGPTFVSIDTNNVMTGFFSAWLGLSLCEGAYLSEIVRGGILSVRRGQFEAAKSLGMRPSQIRWRIVLPQAMRTIIPPAGNRLVTIFKDTSLVSVIAGGDLLTQAKNIYSQNYLVLELLSVVTIWYLVLVSISSYGQSLLERKFSAHTAGSSKRKSFSDHLKNLVPDGRLFLGAKKD